jgi:hypothetical protein
MIESIWRSIFGCSHSRTTFPITPSSAGPQKHGTYVVCTDCGKEFAYSWDKMAIGEPLQAPPPRRWNDGLETRV